MIEPCKDRPIHCVQKKIDGPHPLSIQRQPAIADRISSMEADPSLQSYIECRGWNRIVNCLKGLWNSLFCCFRTYGSGAALFSMSLPLLIDPTLYPHLIKDANKLFVYEQLVQGRSIGDEITITKFSINDPVALESQILFNSERPHIERVDGPFRYDPSTSDTVHWTANFADADLFGYCEGPLLAQDELQVLEHPALAHVKHALPADQRILKLYEAALVQNVPRLGSLNASKPLENGHSLYGNYFTKASHSEILSRLTSFPDPGSSNIFAIAAPRIPLSLSDKPYERKDLENLLFTSYNAFRSIKERCQGQKVVIHSGNWGAGAFGNDPKTVHLIQLASARWAGIDEIRMYPMSNQTEFDEARDLFDQIENEFPQMTVGQFLDHLTANATAYNLRYKQGNGT